MCSIELLLFSSIEPIILFKVPINAETHLATWPAGYRDVLVKECCPMVPC